MIKVDFSYRLDESSNWLWSYAILPLTNASEDDIEKIVSDLIGIINENLVYRTFGYRINNIEEIDINEF